MLKGWQKLSNDSIKKLRLHLKRAAEFIEYAVGEEIIVALAHSDATYEETKQASEKVHPFCSYF